MFAGLGLVEAVAALSRRVQRDWGVSLAVQVGLHTGREVVGRMARGDRDEPLTLGDTQTIAIHLRDCASPDTVLLSQATFRLVEKDCVWAALGTHLLVAGADPLGVYQVLQARVPQQRFAGTGPSGLTPFVGRAPEAGLLHEAWAQATEGLAWRWTSRWPCRWRSWGYRCPHATRRADCRPSASSSRRSTR